MYKRLTERRGTIVIDKCGNCEKVNDPQGCYDSDCHRVMKYRLAELEDKIENGTLDEVVRCKDCRFYEEKHYEEEGEKPYIKKVCKILKKQFQPTFFCCYGELQEQDNEETTKNN